MIGAALVMDGQITFGVITAFIMFVRLFPSPLSTLAQGMTQMQTAAAAGDRIFDFLQEEELSDESYKTEKLTEVHGESNSTMFASAIRIIRTKSLSKIFLLTSSRGRKSLSSVLQVPVRQQWSTF